MTRDKHRKARRLTTALIAGLALAAPAQAGAAGAGVAGGTLTITGSMEASDLSVTAGPAHLVIADANLDVALGSGCTQPPGTPKRVECPSASVTAISVSLGGGDDLLDTSAVSLPATVSGGSGDDHLQTGGGVDSLVGDAGVDYLDGGLGGDNLDGGADGDVALYSSHSTAVTASLGTNQQLFASTGNGSAGEGDSLNHFEYLVGGAGNDVLAGDGNPNYVIGGAGDDVLDGGLGADAIWGGAGSDTLDYSTRGPAAPVTVSLDGAGTEGAAGEGDDVDNEVENVRGGAGADSLTGNGSPNVITGGAGVDSIAALGGDDVVYARDGLADSITCGLGTDTGEVDAIDTREAACESLAEPPPVVAPPPADPPPADPAPPVIPPAPAVIPPAPEGEPATSPPAAEDPTPAPDPVPERDAPPVKVSTPSSVTLSARGDIPVGITCTAAAGACRGTIELVETGGAIKARSQVGTAGTKKVVLGRKSFRVAAGKRQTVQIRLDRRGRQRIIKKKKRKTRAKLVITTTAPDGTKTTTVKSVQIAAPKPRRNTGRVRSGRKPVAR